jgi:murein DD-endopeptidase MepM/ murein hydrolase activator NlpD
MSKNTILALACSGLLISGAVAASLPVTRCNFLGYYEPGQILVLDARVAQGPWIDGSIADRLGSQPHPVLKRGASDNAVDFSAPAGTPVYATSGGSVEKAGNDGAGGKRVVVRYGKDLKVAYSGLGEFGASILANLLLEAAGEKPGKSIGRGQVIGRFCGTGRTTITIYAHGVPVEPLCWCIPAEMPAPHLKGTRVVLAEK